MRADRLLSIMLLLQTYRRMTAHDLANRLEVSERTIHRDMESLSAAGVPVVAERGAGGGWSLMGEYRTNLTGLNEAEIQALFLARSPRSGWARPPKPRSSSSSPRFRLRCVATPNRRASGFTSTAPGGIRAKNPRRYSRSCRMQF